MSHLDQLLDEAGKLGGDVAEAFRPVYEHRARADALSAELEARRRAGEAEFGRLVRAVAAGEVKPDQVPVKLREVSEWAHDSLTARAMVQAAVGARYLADAAAKECGPRAFRALQDLVGVIVRESVALAGRLPATITNESMAVRYGDGDAVKHWQRLRVLVDAWDKAHHVAWLLQMRAQLLGPVDEHELGVQNAGRFLKYRFPEKVPATWRRVAPELRLATAAASGAEPGLYHITEAASRARRRGVLDGRMRVVGPREVQQFMDSHGNVTPVGDSGNQLVTAEQAGLAVSTNHPPIAPAVA